MHELKVSANVERLEEVLDFIAADAEILPADAKFKNNLKIAVEEIFVNIALYAYPSGEGDVVISASTAPDNITVEFRDSGTPYNPLIKTDPDTTLSIDEREIGGLGIFMVKQMMDSVAYRYEDGFNIFTMSKHWSG
ncbi:MAG: ATP-binding protein [Oscillospiraceae bacterium]|nr:ATP-binding protein [Oscillospiraceae bacterium]